MKYYTVVAKQRISDALQSGDFYLLGSYDSREEAKQNEMNDLENFKEYKSCMVHTGILEVNGDLDHMLYSN